MKHFNRNQWIGTALIVLGVLGLLLSSYIKGRVGEEMGNVHAITSPLSGTGPAGKMAGGAIEEQASGQAAPYLQNAQFLMVGGIALIIVGGA